MISSLSIYADLKGKLPNEQGAITSMCLSTLCDTCQTTLNSTIAFYWPNKPFMSGSSSKSLEWVVSELTSAVHEDSRAIDTDIASIVLRDSNDLPGMVRLVRSETSLDVEFGFLGLDLKGAEALINEVSKRLAEKKVSFRISKNW